MLGNDRSSLMPVRAGISSRMRQLQHGDGSIAVLIKAFSLQLLMGGGPSPKNSRRRAPSQLSSAGSWARRAASNAGRTLASRRNFPARSIKQWEDSPVKTRVPSAFRIS